MRLRHVTLLPASFIPVIDRLFRVGCCMANPSKGKMHTVTIFIQWREVDEWETQITLCSRAPNYSTQSQPNIKIIDNREDKARVTSTSSPRSDKHLLPTDRLVLNALSARIPQGEQATLPMRVSELMGECEISRRQVQICLKRLGEKGFIKRLVIGEAAGSHEGYRYQILRRSGRTYGE